MGAEKTEQVNLGIAVAHATCRPGQVRTLREIAAFCECHWQAIYHIEQKTLQKLRKRLSYGRDEVLSEFVKEVSQR